MTGPDTTPPKDTTSADEVRLWLGDHSAGKGLRGRPSASAVDKAVGSLRKPSISFDGADDDAAGKPPRETTHRRGSLERERKPGGTHHHQASADDDHGNDDTDVTDDEDDGGCCGEPKELASIALYWILGKMDLILGVGFLAVAMWVRAKMLLSDDTEQKKTIGDEENTWRWMLFVACILLGTCERTFHR